MQKNIRIADDQANWAKKKKKKRRKGVSQKNKIIYLKQISAAEILSTE